MAQDARDSDRILREAGHSLKHQRTGGRRQFADGRSIGRQSRELKTRHMMRRIGGMIVGVVAVIVTAMGLGLVLGGIGFGGLFYTALAAILVAALLLRYPRLKVPERRDLAQGSLKVTVGKVELWLENQRRALPTPAARLVDHIGMQLDALGLQLDQIDENHAGAAEIRALVSDHLPGLVSTYTAIPAHLRSECREGGVTPDETLVEGLGRISAEIETVTRELASGMIDDLAIKARYLDYKYGS